MPTPNLMRCERFERCCPSSNYPRGHSRKDSPGAAGYITLKLTFRSSWGACHGDKDEVRRGVAATAARGNPIAVDRHIATGERRSKYTRSTPVCHGAHPIKPTPNLMRCERFERCCPCSNYPRGHSRKDSPGAAGYITLKLTFRSPSGANLATKMKASGGECHLGGVVGCYLESPAQPEPHFDAFPRFSICQFSDIRKMPSRCPKTESTDRFVIVEIVV
jgi:hypothetical protein